MCIRDSQVLAVDDAKDRQRSNSDAEEHAVMDADPAREERLCGRGHLLGLSPCRSVSAGERRDDDHRPARHGSRQTAELVAARRREARDQGRARCVHRRLIARVRFFRLRRSLDLWKSRREGIVDPGELPAQGRALLVALSQQVLELCLLYTSRCV